MPQRVMEAALNSPSQQEGPFQLSISYRGLGGRSRCKRALKAGPPFSL
jgi:hypothetical protein